MNLETREFTNFSRGFSKDLQESVWQIQEDRKGHLWLAIGDSLVKFNPSNNEYQAYRYSEHESRLNELQQDALGNFWMGGTASFVKFDPQTEKFTSYQPNRPLNVEAIFLDSQETLWIGTVSEGVFRFDTKTNEFIAHFDSSPTAASHLSDNRVYRFYEDRI